MIRRGLWRDIWASTVRFVDGNAMFAGLDRDARYDVKYSVAQFAYRQVQADRRRAKKAAVLP